MSGTTSEQLLKDLEHSTADPSELLNQAIFIAGVQFDPSSKSFTKPSQRQLGASNDFREQWLLKWALKRSNENVSACKKAGQAGQPSHGLIHHSNLWSLISYLLSAISAQKAIGICLERNFCSLLTQASTLLLSDYSSKTEDHAIASSNGTESERPRKRVRLSPDPVHADSAISNNQSGSPTAAITLLPFVKVLEEFASLLQSVQHSSNTSARSVIPAWAASSKDAAAFVGSVLACAHPILDPTIDHTSYQKEVAANAAILWLRLWRKFSNSSASLEKELVAKAFNEACLANCLSLYVSTTRATQDYMVAAKKEVEIQIALYTVLPLRSTFEKRLAATWKQDQKVISWHDIEPVIEMMHKKLGNALHTQTFGTHQYFSLPDQHWAPSIISIAARLIPKDDIRKRQREIPWLDALTLSLAHLTFPKEMARLHEGQDGLLYPGSETFPSSSDLLLKWPDEILDILAEDEIHLSVSTKVYLTSSLLFWRSRPLSVSLLAKIVKLDPEMFVPSIHKQKSSSLLENLVSTLNGNRTLDGSQYRHAIEAIVCPIMEAFAKARDLEGLINMWLPNLEDALRVRTSASFSTDSMEGDIPTALIWDNEDVFSWFTELCQLHAPVNFGRALLNETTIGLKDVSERIGSTIDLFAKAAVLQCILMAKGEDFSTSSENRQDLNKLTNAVVEVVQHPNDYQGQRWRLWSILVVLCTLGIRFDLIESLAGTTEQRCTRFRSMTASEIDVMQQGQRSALLIEQYSMFKWLVAQCKYTSSKDNSGNLWTTELLRKEIGHLAKYIRKQEILGTKDSEPHFVDEGHISWDGQLNTLLSIRQLTDGQIACLAMLDDSSSEQNIVRSLLSTLQESAQLPTQDTFAEVVTNHLAASDLELDDDKQSSLNDSYVTKSERFRESKHVNHHENASLESLEVVAHEAQAHLSERNVSQSELVKDFLEQAFQKPDQASSAIFAGAAISTVDTTDLQSNPFLGKTLAAMISLRDEREDVGTSTISIVLRLELCMLTLMKQPQIVNQSSIDALLESVAAYSSSTVKFEPVSFKGEAVAIFNRLLGIIGILLTRHRRRLNGRTHLLLPVLQNLLKCFFYTSSKVYIYQNAATSKQKQMFRSSLPLWLGSEALPASSAVKFSKLVSSICNPTTASARSAHRTRRKRGPESLELNDETRKARRIAAQYMQYLIMEYARCNLDGVIKPEVREKLMPGMYSILDAMDRDLMKVMNSAMDPSSRAIFKGLYDDWAKHWRWDQT